MYAPSVVLKSQLFWVIPEHRLFPAVPGQPPAGTQQTMVAVAQRKERPAMTRQEAGSTTASHPKQALMWFEALPVKQ